jgi:hypothetical protein
MGGKEELGKFTGFIPMASEADHQGNLFERLVKFPGGRQGE